MRAILLYSSMMLLESGGTSTVEDNQEPVTVHNLSAPSGDDQYTAAISAAMTAMEARLTATFEAKFTAVETVFDQRVSELGAKYEANFAKVEATRRLSVRNDGGIVPTAEISGGRRLSVGDTHLAVPALQLHEFPDGHTCPNTGTKSMRALPHTGSDVTYKPSPQWTASTDNELSLSTIYEDWSTSEIQRMPFPMKVVHEGNCTATPKLELQLSTTVLGSLTVDGYDVGAALRQLGATKTYSRLLGSTSCGTYDGTYQVTWHLGNTGASCSSACSTAGKTCDNTILNDEWVKAPSPFACMYAVAASLAVGSDSEWACTSAQSNNPAYAPYIGAQSGHSHYKMCNFAGAASNTQSCSTATPAGFAKRFCPCKPS